MGIRSTIVLGLVVTFGILGFTALWVGYGSNNYLFQDGSTPLTANWDVGAYNITNIDSLVATGHVFGVNLLASATTPVNSAGFTFPTIQATVNNLSGNGWVYVPSGIWNEAITIVDDDVLLFGAGRSTEIRGDTTGHAIAISGDFCIIRDLMLRTLKGQGNTYHCIYATGHRGYITRVWTQQSDDDGFYMDGDRWAIMQCYIFNCDGDGIYLHGIQHRVVSTDIYAMGGHGIHIGSQGDNAVVNGNTVDTLGDDGIYINAFGENCIIDGNRILSYTNEAIDDDSGTSTIGDNDTT